MQKVPREPSPVPTKNKAGNGMVCKNRKGDKKKFQIIIYIFLREINSFFLLGKKSSTATSSATVPDGSIAGRLKIISLYRHCVTIFKVPPNFT